MIMNTQKFIVKAKDIHGDKNDYSKTEYIFSRVKVIITCKVHGDFEQIPYKHLSGQGCPKCENKVGYNYHKTQKFTKKAKAVHGNKYDYSKVKYINSQTKITIICKKHGDYEQLPYKHINGAGCNKCVGLNITTDDWIKEARAVHGNRFDYSKTNYVDSTTNVTITCKVHGDFEQLPYSHIKGIGCSKCSGKYKYSTEDWIEKAKNVYGDKYDYSKTEYINRDTKVIITCKEHGDFEQRPYVFLQGYGCRKCATALRYSTTEWIKKAKAKHGDKYDYSMVDYRGSKYNVTIICKEHGKYREIPGKHLKGIHCPKCVRKGMV